MQQKRVEAITKRAYSDAKHEWNRLIKNPVHMLEFQTTLYYLNRFMPKKGRILDIGGGPGRYAIYLAKKGYRMTLLDISPQHIAFAKAQTKSAKVSDKFDEFKEGSMLDLSDFKDNTFDSVICLGGPLSHIAKENKRLKALKELTRVAKKDSFVFVSVMGKWGTLSTPYSLTNSEMRRTKHTRELVRGEDKMWKGRYYAHYFTLEELLELFSKVKGLKVVKTVGLQGLTSTWPKEYIRKFSKDKKAWKNLMNMNKEVREILSVVDNSRHMLIIAKKIR